MIGEVTGDVGSALAACERLGGLPIVLRPAGVSPEQARHEGVVMVEDFVRRMRDQVRDQIPDWAAIAPTTTALVERMSAEMVDGKTEVYSRLEVVDAFLLWSSVAPSGLVVVERAADAGTEAAREKVAAAAAAEMHELETMEAAEGGEALKDAVQVAPDQAPRRNVNVTPWKDGALEKDLY